MSIGCKIIQAALLSFALVFGGGAFAQEQKVVVYTPLKSGPVKVLLDQFTADTGIATEMVNVNTGTLLRRVKAESGRPQGDVLLSLGAVDLHTTQDLLMPYASPNLAKVRPEFLVEGNWLPFSAATAIVIINTDEVDEASRPKGWKDLADERWRGKIASTKADLSGNAFQALATVLKTTDDIEDGWKLYEGLLRNYEFGESAGAVARMVNDGEIPIGITLEDNALDYVNGGGPVAIIYPEEGTSIVPDGMAIINNAPHQEAAKKLIDWMLDSKGQTEIVKQLGRRSVSREVDALAEGSKPYAEIKRTVYDIPTISANREDMVNRWKALYSTLR